MKKKNWIYVQRDEQIQNDLNLLQMGMTKNIKEKPYGVCIFSSFGAPMEVCITVAKKDRNSMAEFPPS